MNNSKTIPIFFACDNNFVKYTVVSLKSIMANASKDYHYIVHILNIDISEEMQKKIHEMADENFEIRFENVMKYLDTVSEKLPIRDYYSKTTYYRMFIAEMFTEYDKAIYIDSDTVVPGDISELYNHDIGDNYVGAAHEQAMVQVDGYGTYVEKCLGIDRNNYFNAGLLLINCKQFRDNSLLLRFIEMLDVYTFVVTQDEDYLNILCHNKVFWLGQQWNTEVFGEIPYDESEFKMLHYIMVSKPWHYADCRYGEYFWKYAKETFVFDEIKNILDSYTDEQREKDRVSCDRLLATAIYETNKPDNYLSIVTNGTTRSKERRLILDKIAKFEREGRFDEDVEDDPPSRELQPGEVDYLYKKPSSKIKAKMAYRAARKFVYKLMDDKQFVIKDIKGIEQRVRNTKTAATEGGIMTAETAAAEQVLFFFKGRLFRSGRDLAGLSDGTATNVVSLFSRFFFVLILQGISPPFLSYSSPFYHSGQKKSSTVTLCAKASSFVKS